MKVKTLCAMVAMAAIIFLSLSACGKKGPLKPIAAEKKTSSPQTENF